MGNEAGVDLGLPTSHGKMARAAVIMSLGSLFAVLTAALVLGMKVGGREQEFSTIRTEVSCLRVEKADKATIDARLDAIQESQREIKRTLEVIVNRQIQK